MNVTYIAHHKNTNKDFQELVQVLSRILFLSKDFPAPGKIPVQECNDIKSCFSRFTLCIKYAATGNFFSGVL